MYRLRLEIVPQENNISISLKHQFFDFPKHVISKTTENSKPN